MTLDPTPPVNPGTAPAADRPSMPKALRWFLAEFLVVVVGVLVALAVSAWWQSRQDRAHERLYLQQLDADLLATENEMHDAMAALTERAVAAASVEHAFWGQRPSDDDVLTRNFALPWGTSRYRPVLGNIEALISSGDIDVIRSAPLRTALVSYVEWSKARLDNISRYDETYYRPAVNEMQSQLDISSLRMETLREKNAGRAHAFDMSSIAATGRPPFPVDLDSALQNRVVYNAYAKLMLAHRNQAGEYGQILERARLLHAQVYRQLHGMDEPGNCQLTRESVSADFIGTCGAAFSTGDRAGKPIQLRLREAEAVTSGAWKIDDSPAIVVTGQMTVGGGTAGDLEVEASLVRDGVLRSQQGWFPVTMIAVSNDKLRLSFRVDTRQEVPANAMDLAILNQAKVLLRDASHWDRKDDRQCRPDKSALSLYCALIKASRIQSGGVHHRRPAMQMVRALVDERSAGRGYQHRLRDYNNDPRTSLADIQQLLDGAIANAKKDRDQGIAAQ